MIEKGTSMRIRIETLLGLIATVSILLASPALGQYIRVNKNGVNIRVAPSPSGALVSPANEGDVFVLKGISGEWFEVAMFSGEYRYLHSSLATRVDSVPALPAAAETRKAACFELVRAQDRAVAESQQRFPADFSSRIDLERLLYDRYELPIFQKHGIAPAHSAKLVVECAKNNWIPR
jgi:hypothetical protein